MPDLLWIIRDHCFVIVSKSQITHDILGKKWNIYLGWVLWTAYAHATRNKEATVGGQWFRAMHNTNLVVGHWLTAWYVIRHESSTTYAIRNYIVYTSWLCNRPLILITSTLDAIWKYLYNYASKPVTRFVKRYGSWTSYQSTSEFRWRSRPGGLFRFDCNYLELKYRRMVIVDRAVRSTNCVKQRNARLIRDHNRIGDGIEKLGKSGINRPWLVRGSIIKEYI